MPHAATGPRGCKKSKTALDVLKADHDEARKLFKQFEKFSKSEDTGGMQQVARVACEARLPKTDSGRHGSGVFRCTRSRVHRKPTGTPPVV